MDIRKENWSAVVLNNNGNDVRQRNGSAVVCNINGNDIRCCLPNYPSSKSPV